MQRLIITGRGCGGRTASIKERARRHVVAAGLCQPSRLLPIALLCAAQVAASVPVRADPVPETMNGVPLLPIPTYEEVGLPSFTMPSGTPRTTDPNAPSSPKDPGGDGSGDGSDSPAMATMMSRSWGAAAEANAQSLGVNATALAATCVLESNCQNLGGTGTINGAFQMSNGTYTEAMAAAFQQNPNLAANIVPGLAGKSDPATQSIAAAEYLRQGALALQTNNVSNPTVLDVRGYYQFGPGNASAIARAPDNTVLSNLVPLTAQQYQDNRITPGVTTVGQWRTSVTTKIGASTAQAPVLLPS